MSIASPIPATFGERSFLDVFATRNPPNSIHPEINDRDWTCQSRMLCHGHLHVSDSRNNITAASAASVLGHPKVEDVEDAITLVALTSNLPLADDFLSAIKKCREEKDLIFARWIHLHLWNNGLEHTGNFLVPLFVECGCVRDANRIFLKLPNRNEFSWTSLIQGYVECGEPDYALNLFEKMQDTCIRPSKFTFMKLLKACTDLKLVENGRQIHYHIILEEFEADQILGNTIIDMYSKCGWLLDAQNVLYNLPAQDVISWTTLIKGFTEHGLGHEGVNAYKKMLFEGISPNDVTFICTLKACVISKDIDMVFELHAEIVREGYEFEAFVSNTLLDAYAKCGFFLEAKETFHVVQLPDVVSWNALATNFVEYGLNEEALFCVDEMQSQGICQDDVTYICSLKASGNLRAIENGQHLHTQIIKRGYESNHFIGISLVDMYAKCGFLVEAQFLFDLLPSGDTVLWNSLLSGYADHRYIDDTLRCLTQMQLNVISLDAVSFATALRACASIRAIDEGQKLHADVIVEGLDNEVNVSNSLLEMYANCGLVVDAKDVFAEISARGSRSWNLLTYGYFEYGYVEEVLDCLEEMELDGVPATTYAYICCLHVCGDGTNVSSIHCLHNKIVKRGLETHSYLCSALINAYTKCDLLFEAQNIFKGISKEELASQSALIAGYAKSGAFKEADELFNALPLQTVVSWTTLIAGYADYGLGEKALETFERMKSHCIVPDSITYICCLKACGSIRSVEKGRSLHISIIKEGLEDNCSIGNSLIRMYAELGLFDEAWKVFHKLRVHSVASWTGLMVGYVEYGYGEEAFSCLDCMQTEGLFPSLMTYVLISKACGCMGSLLDGHSLHSQIIKVGFEADLFLCSSLVDMYSKCGALCEAERLFDEHSDRDVVSWNALISAYVQHGFGEKALECFEQMEMEGIDPNAVAFVSGLKACSSCRSIEGGFGLHAKIIEEGLEEEPSIGGALVVVYAKCSLLNEAQDVFDELLVRDIVPWTALLTGYAEHGFAKEGLNYLDQMEMEGISADAVILLSTLKACGTICDLRRGRAMHGNIVKKGLDRDLSICNTLVDFYARCGFLSEAQELFEKLSIREIVSWNALIAGYARQGESEAVFHLYTRLKGEGVVPTKTTYLNILSVCSHSGLLQEAKMYFNAMGRDFGIIPTIKHHNCLLDLLSRAGQIEEMVGLVNMMPYEPDLVTWKIVLDSCRKLGRLDLSEWIFQNLLTRDQRQSELFVLMCNIYADLPED